MLLQGILLYLPITSQHTKLELYIRAMQSHGPFLLPFYPELWC